MTAIRLRFESGGVCLKTHGRLRRSTERRNGSLANRHPRLHLPVTNGGFRPDGRFVALPWHDVAASRCLTNRA